MARFRPFAMVLIAVLAALTASDVSGKGSGGHKGGGGGHKSAPHRAAPKVHAAHHSGPKPNRVNRKPPAHHASHPQAHKEAHHPPARPKGPVKVSKPEDKHREPPKHDAGKKDPKKEPGTPTNKPKAPPKRPEVKPKEPNKAKRPDEKAKDLAKNHRLESHPKTRDLHSIGRRHAAVHHFAHFDRSHHRYWFDRHWWWNFVDYPASCDDGQDVPEDYCVDGDPGSWVNYEAAVPPENVLTEPPPAIQEGQGLPISRTGAILAERLDGMDVENHWLPGQDVSWKTGNPVDDNPGPASNGSEFVAAVCARMKVVIAEPVPENFFPDMQYDWLVDVGTASGWVAVGGDVEAQLLANQGWVVVAAWKAPTQTSDRSLDGQMGIVHPDSKPVEAVADRGPTITVAGQQNYANIALKDSFPQAAWDQVIYMACRPRW
ncbi:MAG TPA: hypothetical protein VEI07_18685 [Planctomycetaceae bacterium]|nr:hypothetical protein [Planctomycetaceae bacterium]